MRKKLAILAIVVVSILTLTGCQRSWEKMRKSVQVVNRNYTIKQYSGGILIGEYKFKGTLNSSENSDGYYWYQGDTLYEVSGDLVITSTK